MAEAQRPVQEVRGVIAEYPPSPETSEAVVVPDGNEGGRRRLGDRLRLSKRTPGAPVAEARQPAGRMTEDH